MYPDMDSTDPWYYYYGFSTLHLSICLSGFLLETEINFLSFCFQCVWSGSSPWEPWGLGSVCTQRFYLDCQKKCNYYFFKHIVCIIAEQIMINIIETPLFRIWPKQANPDPSANNLQIRIRNTACFTSILVSWHQNVLNLKVERKQRKCIM